MKNAPNSKTNLDRAILRFAGDVARSNDLRSLMANSSAYNGQKGDLPVLPTVDEAVVWANELIEKINKA